MSLAMAMSIFRRFSICFSSVEENFTRVSLVTPSTRSATVAPNRWATSSWVASVSSMVSWRRAAITESASSPSSATRWATSRGWVI